MIQESSKFQKIRWAILFIIAVTIAGLALLQRRGPQKTSFPILGTIPEFSLIAEDGTPVTANHFMRKIVIVDFIFTHCAGTCPVMTLQMAKLQKAFAKYVDILFVSISVDPERDTPERLQKYAKNAGALQGRWIFLTGEKAAVHQLARKGFHLGVGEDAGSELEPIIHSAKFVLLDRQARIRGYYDGTEDESVQKLAKDIENLRSEE